MTGNIDEKAVVVANTDGTVSGLAWQINSGVADSPKILNTGWTLSNIANGCMVAATSDIATGVFAFGYWGVYDLYYSRDMSSTTVAVAAPASSNENNNCLATVTFNGANYLAAGIGAHFSWGYVPQLLVYDITNPNQVTSFHAVPYSELNVGGFKGVTGATSDVLIVVSEDGYYMDVYFVDANYDLITCYEFDCIQQ